MNRLKFDLKTRPPVLERSDKEPCGICKRHTSRYTCPTCNLPYCSLTCFRDEAHSECSESFYRKEIESDINAAPAKSAEDRNKMLEMLRRFEAQDAEASQHHDSDDSDDDDDFAHRMQGINLDEADPDTLWSVLSPAQRDAFLTAVQDPAGARAQQLLASAELHSARRRPWWEAPRLDADAAGGAAASAEFGAPPRMRALPRLPAPDSPRFLAYNILALCLAYAYVTRRLSVSPLSAADPAGGDRAAARALLAGAAPFLAERASTLLLGSVDALATYMWARLEAVSDPPSHASFAALLADAASLFRPDCVSVVPQDAPAPAPADDKDEAEDAAVAAAASHPSRAALLVISDIAALFARGAGDTPAPAPAKRTHVLHKLDFYAAYLCAQPPDTLRVLAEEARITGLRMHPHP